MHLLRRIDIKYRLIITFLIISILPLIFLSIFNFRMNSQAMRNKISASTTQLLALVNMNMMTEIEKYQYLCGSICINSDIQDSLLLDNITIEKNSIMLKIQTIVKTKIIYPAQAKNITIVDVDKNIFYNLGYDGFYNDDLVKMLETLDSTTNDCWRYVKTYRASDIIVLGRKIYNQYNTDEVIGYTLISIDERLFSDTLLSPVNLQEGSNIFFMDSNGFVLSSWNDDLVLGDAYPSPDLIENINKLGTKSGSFLLEFKGEEQLVNYIYNRDIDKFFISFIPMSYVNSESNIITKDLLLTSSILLLLCCVVIVFIYLSISVPIRKMVDICQHISIGNLEERICDQSNDELAYLSDNIDSMVEKIQNLLVEQQQHEKKKHDLELQMLQYQINPHFLFNTLNTFRLVAAMNHDVVVSEGIQSLSELLKNTLMNSQEFITIEDEIKNLKHYLSILTLRYAGSFHVNYEIDETLVHYLVPKLILQPLAENAVMHGSKNDGSILELTVSCFTNEMNVVLELSDDGRGFDSTIKQEPRGLGGIGNNNVNDRIRLNFGEEYGLQVTSDPGKGTVCQILLPKILS